MTHMKAARDLCIILFSEKSGIDEGFRRFCIMYFVAHEVMSRPACVQSSLFEPSEWFAGDDETEVTTILPQSWLFCPDIRRLTP